MKAVAEIVAAIILLVSGSCITPKLIGSFKVNTFLKVNQGLSPLSDFSEKLSRP